MVAAVGAISRGGGARGGICCLVAPCGGTLGPFLNLSVPLSPFICKALLCEELWPLDRGAPLALCSHRLSIDQAGLCPAGVTDTTQASVQVWTLILFILKYPRRCVCGKEAQGGKLFGCHLSPFADIASFLLGFLFTMVTAECW